MMPTPTTSMPAPQILRRIVKRQERRQLAAERRKAAAKEKAEREEARAEHLAPKVQRMPVYARDGKTVLRGSRVEQSGATMVRSNPVKRLAAHSRGKDFPTVGAAHVHIAARDEVLRIRARLGALWPVIHAVVICHIDPSAWGEAQGMNPHVSVGYVTAALDLLVRCYEPPERKRGRILVAEFESLVFQG